MTVDWRADANLPLQTVNTATTQTSRCCVGVVRHNQDTCLFPQSYLRASLEYAIICGVMEESNAQVCCC